MLVRCATDKTVFQISPITFEPLSCSYYDPYCFTDPRTDVDYISYTEWLRIREQKRSAV